VGALAVGTEVMYGFPPFQKQIKPFMRSRPAPKAPGVDYRYAPEEWQSAFCFPNDPFKSLVSKTGEMLYGHPGPDAPADAFAQAVSFGFRDRESGAYVSQQLDAAGVPVITTVLGWKDLKVTMLLFATNAAGEGRVDNLLVTVAPQGKETVAITPEVRIASKTGLSSDTKDMPAIARKEMGIATLESKPSRTFFVADAPVDHAEDKGVHRFRMKKEELAPGQTLSYVLRFPQEAQPAENVAGGLILGEKLLAEVRAFWQTWTPTSAPLTWTLSGPLHDFLVASSRTMSQCRLSKDGKGSYLAGPTVARTLPPVAGHFLAEAALYLGNVKEAKETLVAIWDRQDENGAVLAPAGDQHAKNTAAAIYALVRYAELSQDWDYFNELYPDAYKAAMYLRGLRNAALGDGTANGTYGLIQKGIGDNGLSGVRAEFSDTLWTLIALKPLLEVADRLFLDKRSDIREFLGLLRASFIAAAKKEMQRHPNGFSYLPMLLKDDALWQEKDPLLKPRAQTAQITLSQALYPGVVVGKDDNITKGHLELMRASLKEDVPAETGWLTTDGVWNANAAVAAQVFLWAGMPEEARAIFVGFLNHASPLLSWRQEQPLRSAALKKSFGDMPESWAAAECVRYLRHTLVLEDDKILRLLDGVTESDIAAGKPLALGATPTRWGKISVSLEPVDAKTWVTKFTREPADEKNMPPLTSVVMPLHLPGKLIFATFSGPSVIKNAPQAVIDASLLSWEVTWKNFRRS
jgi:hypothetical protein